MTGCRAETDALLVKAGIEWQPFSESAMAELPRVADPSQWSVPEAEALVRRDLRSADHLICSIDPPGVFGHLIFSLTNAIYRQALLLHEYTRSTCRLQYKYITEGGSNDEIM